MRALLGIMVALIAAAPASAQKQPADPTLERCLATKTAQAGVDQVTGCYSSALNRTDAQLLQAEDALRKRATQQKLGAVVTVGYSAWRTYRDRWCTFEERFEGDPQARPSTGLMCRYELARSHLARMNRAN